MTSLTLAVREALLAANDVSHLTSLKRSNTLYSQGQSADFAYFMDEGLVKLTRMNEGGGRIILGISGAMQLIGEEALSEDCPTYYTEAEVLTPASAIRIPRESLKKTIADNPDVGSALINYLLCRKLALAEKVELLCLHDVEYRILHYLAELSNLVKPLADDDGHQIPITQLELADLIGATRETTSTTLNQLERRGLIKLSRRLLVIPSPVSLRAAAEVKVNGATTAAIT